MLVFFMCVVVFHFLLMDKDSCLHTTSIIPNTYHAEINEQNSVENCSDGGIGGGLSTMVSISSKMLSQLSL